MKISLIHASFKSLGQSKRVRDTWLELASTPDHIEHCLGFEEEDFEVRSEFSIPIKSQSGLTWDGLTKFQSTPKATTPSVTRNWNAAGAISSGEILVVISDDLVPMSNWDVQIRALFSDLDSGALALFCLTDARCHLRIDQDYIDVLLPRHPVMSREVYERYGFIFNPNLVTKGGDLYWLLEGVSQGFFRDARHIRLHHSLGVMFTEQGELRCGCFNTSELKRIETTSQAVMLSSKWDSIHKQELKQYGFWWRFIEGLMLTRTLSDPTFVGYMHLVNQKSKISPFKILYAAWIMRETTGVSSHYLFLNLLKCFSWFSVKQIRNK